MFRWLTVSLVGILGGCSAGPAPNVAALEAEARDISQRFVGTLLPTLQQAMQNGGPAAAIEVCAVQAPEIAAALSAASGWQVRRVSLKARNASLATPDSFEQAVLTAFDRRQAAGEPGPQIHHSEVRTGPDGREYRFLQAQPAQPLCLTCHGDTLLPEVSAALAQYYPLDRATGYQAGQIRGAITLRKILE